MHRCIATVLLALFSWTLVVSAFANPGASAVPACCRKSGQHQCEMRHSSGDAQSVTTLAAKCPCSPGAPGTMHAGGFAPDAARAIYARLTAHPARWVQTDSAFCLSSVHAHQKRGPPSFLSL